MEHLPTQLYNVENDSADKWSALKAFTSARIALGRIGTSVPLEESLAFKLAHAHARDAVYSGLHLEEISKKLQLLHLPFHYVQSQASNRQEYLQRPDLGRKLNIASQERLKELSVDACDVAIVVADGLSATAINDHAMPLLQLLVPKLQQAGFNLAPLTVAEQARVAISDEIGEILKARLSLILIGERPGLSSPNSLGAYFTYAPKSGLTDESRNCISNIRPEGLPYNFATDKIFYLIQEALRKKLTGVVLKDEMDLLQG